MAPTGPGRQPPGRVPPDTAKPRRRQPRPERKEIRPEADVVPTGSPASQRLGRAIAAALRDVHHRLVQNEAYLGEIDAVAGDGDHGIGMVRGARAAAEAAETCVAAGAGARTVLERAADAWEERAGGTSGALWGAAIHAVADVLDDHAVPAPDAAVAAVENAVDAVVRLGGAAIGDKTMVDAALPFAEAIRANAEHPLAEAWTRAVTVAADAASGTAAFGATKGRARTHAEKSIGTPDPGAVSFAAIVEVLAAHLPGADQGP